MIIMKKKMKAVKAINEYENDINNNNVNERKVV